MSEEWIWPTGGTEDPCSISCYGQSGGLHWELGGKVQRPATHTLRGKHADSAGLLHFVPLQSAPKGVDISPLPQPFISKQTTEASPVDQAEGFHRTHPRICVPFDLLRSSLEHPSGHNHLQVVQSNQLAVVGNQESPVILYPSHPGGDTVSCTSLAADAGVRNEEPVGLGQPIRQLALSTHKTPDDRQLLVARATYAIAVYEATQADPKLEHKATVYFRSQVADSVWNPYITSELAVVTEDDEVHILDLERTCCQDGAKSSEQDCDGPAEQTHGDSPKLRKWTVRPATKLTAEQRLVGAAGVGGSSGMDALGASGGWLRLVYGASPRTLFFINRNELISLDFREGSQHAEEQVLLRLKTTEALPDQEEDSDEEFDQAKRKTLKEEFCAVGWSCETGGQAQAWLALATTRRLLLFDVGDLEKPLLQWSHLMEEHPPQLLFFTPPQTPPSSHLLFHLIAVSCTTGAVLCFPFGFPKISDPTSSLLSALDVPYRLTAAQPCLAGIAPIFSKDNTMKLFRLTEAGKLSGQEFVAVPKAEAKLRKAGVSRQEESAESAGTANGKVVPVKAELQKKGGKLFAIEKMPHVHRYVLTGHFQDEEEARMSEGLPGSLQGEALRQSLQSVGQKLEHPLTVKEAAGKLLEQALPYHLRPSHGKKKKTSTLLTSASRSRGFPRGNKVSDFYRFTRPRVPPLRHPPLAATLVTTPLDTPLTVNTLPEVGKAITTLLEGQGTEKLGASVGLGCSPIDLGPVLEPRGQGGDLRGAEMERRVIFAVDEEEGHLGRVVMHLSEGPELTATESQSLSSLRQQWSARAASSQKPPPSQNKPPSTVTATPVKKAKPGPSRLSQQGPSQEPVPAQQGTEADLKRNRSHATAPLGSPLLKRKRQNRGEGF